VVALWLRPNHNSTTYCVFWRTTTTINPIIIRPHCLFTDRRQQRQPNHNTTTYWVYWPQYLMVLWLGCRCCRPSVSTICGRIMIGLSLSSASKHNMCNPIIIRSHCIFTDRRQQRQPNHNTTTYCVYLRTTTINPIIIRPHCMFTVRRQQRQPNHNTTTYCVVVLWLDCRCLPSVNAICGRIMIGLSLLSSDSKHNMWSIIIELSLSSVIRPHIVFTDGRQQRQPNHNTTTYCVYWRTTTTTQL
jgi:hypothetical protein